MTEVSFYHLTRSSLEQALPRLLEKILDAQKRAIVYGTTPQRMESLNTSLWTFGRGSFIPHGTEKEGNAEDQPVWLTTESENPNGATFLVMVENQKLPDLTPYERCLILFDGNNDTALKDARASWKDLKDKGLSITYWAQTTDGKWEKAA
ncbi:DNA polymerase III subunit chi [Candidatus Bealeia paramacronuclearis]|uniref:DNA polymerase III subunit chi n=1 Tax=Candidatus Bealeia paramacronuclearis TaxID=1921001 RepID=A0ABZ2C2C4_9PROT|nr:DNA polymerase III subunit chi [Candidatus Bealeia paramacronuclearis]